jgi:hypothetical protein
MVPRVSRLPVNGFTALGASAVTQNKVATAAGSP